VGVLSRLLLKPSFAKKITLLLLNLHQRNCSMLSMFACAAEGGLHPKHRLMDYHKFFIDNIDKNNSVLDLGCGNGALTFDIAAKAKVVKGIDNNPHNIKICNMKYSKGNIKYELDDITKISMNMQYDVVILSNVLEHIEGRIDFLKKISLITEKLLLRVPMIDRDWITLYKKELRLSYMSDSTHKIEYTLETFKDEIIKSGFVISHYSIQFGEIWAVCSKLIL